MAIVVINGVLASKEDKRLLSKHINEYDIDFDVVVKSGIQYVTTFN